MQNGYEKEKVNILHVNQSKIERYHNLSYTKCSPYKVKIHNDLI